MTSIYVNKANKYARDVVSRKVTACNYVLTACQRHLDDLSKEKDPDYPYVFDKKRAERVCKFMQMLPHTKGEWALKRQLITLEPWQLFIVACVFGWIEKKTKLRRFTKVYTEVPRKNGKSAISAGVGLYMMCADNEYGAEVYSGATSEKQAWEVFKPARLMCINTPNLKEAFGLEINAKNINKLSDYSKFEPVIGNPGDGASPSCAIVDEYHEHKTASLYETMVTGMGARKQPVVWVITTAGSDIESPCYQLRNEVTDLLNADNDDRNEHLFGIIYTIDEGDDWTSKEALKKANPNLGISVYEKNLFEFQQQAIRNAAYANTFKTKHLNVWVSARSAYFNLEAWKDCADDSLALETFEGQECYISLDLASKIDICATVNVFKRTADDGKTHYYCIEPRFYLPEDTIYNNEHRSSAERYQRWLNNGYLTPTDGAEVDYNIIKRDIIDLSHRVSVLEVPHDPWGAFQLAHDLESEGLTPVNIPQNVAHLSPAMKELNAAILSGRFHHDGNPVLTWMISNVTAKEDANENVFPRKEKPESKIDGAVALIMAIGRAMTPDDSMSLSKHIESVGIRSL